MLPRAVVGLAVLLLAAVPAPATAARPKAPSKAKAQRYLSKTVKDPQGQTILEKVISCTKPRKRSGASRCSVTLKFEAGRTCSDPTVNVRYRSKRGPRLKASGLKLVCVSPPPPPPPVTPAAPGGAPAVDPTVNPPITEDQLPPIVDPGGPHGGPPAFDIAAHWLIAHRHLRVALTGNREHGRIGRTSGRSRVFIATRPTSSVLRRLRKTYISITPRTGTTTTGFTGTQ